ncbi:MAG TPA: peptidylprolyl isomerase [Gammaproteobacteria bacterium]|nr:peptidylprolyl isomerase [Gammaproteobacteria bacterium]
MQIANNKVVTIDYVLTDDQGNVIDRSEGGRFAYLHGANNIIPGLERALDGKEKGDSLAVSIPPEEGYGQRDESLTQVVSRSAFESPDDIEVGRQFHAQSPEGQPLVITVVAVADDEVTIDGNHPLAGANLNFDISIVDVRDATEEELSHGHVHGPGGVEHA